MKHNWQQWIDTLDRDDVSEQEIAEFMDTLESSPDAKREYMEALCAEAALESVHRDSVSQIDSPQTIQAATFATPKISRKQWTMLAASIALIAALSYYMGNQNTLAPVAAPSVDYVATITDTNETADAAGLRIGELLETGEIKVPENAEIGIAMRGGARLKINGPAVFHIDSQEKIFLHKGRVQTYAPEYAHGFVIATNEGKVIDLGTRFVTATGTDVGTEIHVIEGLVKAKATQKNSKMTFIGGEQAAILKNGKMISTDYLAQRLHIPLDLRLPDADGDKVPDVIETHYSTNANDPSSKPRMLRISESFNGYPSGGLKGAKYQGLGDVTTWEGSGRFLKEGLDYKQKELRLISSGGCIETTGKFGAGATIILDKEKLPSDGVVYISFLMQQPTTAKHVYSGLLLYLGDFQESFFMGELYSTSSYGTRMAQRQIKKSFAVKADNEPHLFLIRIDQTRMLTDVYIDPPLGPLGKPDTSLLPQARYDEVPQFDRIKFRSGSGSGYFPVRFDELRVGLTWDSVLPVE